VESLEVGCNLGVTVLFGASGSGKTTILRCLAGIERPDEGCITFDGAVWFAADEKIHLPPERRSVGLVPQTYALFPHLTVAANLAYGLRGGSAGERENRVRQTLSRLGLDGLERKRPAELSGGQQQRVALGRAVVRRPGLLLLDEPLAALDLPTRLQLRNQLQHWLAELQIPTLLVTHDRTEALALAQRVVVIARGRMVQSGPVVEVFNRPANLEVAQVVGVETVVTGELQELSDDLAVVKVGTVELHAIAADLPTSTRFVHVCIRAEDVILTPPGEVSSSARNRLRARVTVLRVESPLVRLELDCGFLLKAVVTRQAAEELRLAVGGEVLAWIKAPHVHLIPSVS